MFIRSKRLLQYAVGTIRNEIGKAKSLFGIVVAGARGTMSISQAFAIIAPSILLLARCMTRFLPRIHFASSFLEPQIAFHGTRKGVPVIPALFLVWISSVPFYACALAFRYSVDL